MSVPSFSVFCGFCQCCYKWKYSLRHIGEIGRINFRGDRGGS